MATHRPNQHPQRGVRTISRRALLQAGLTGAVGIALPLGMWGTGALSPRSPEVAKFAVPLPIPPVLEPDARTAEGDRYTVTQRAAEVEILPGLRTTIWGYNGIFPGPTIVARRDRPVTIRHVNELPVPTVVHLHGGVTPPESDGYPTDLILPSGANTLSGHVHGQGVGSTVGHRDYVYPNAQRAATLWYHDHRMDFTGPQVYRGLAGLYLIRDDAEEALPLPRDERDIPLVICDRRFHADGSLDYPAVDDSLLHTPGVDGSARNGMRGDVILVNGAPWPELDVAAVRYRLRILNASNAREYELALDPRPGESASSATAGTANGDFTQIASDGGLLHQPQPRRRLRLAPAERQEVVIDFSRYPVGTRVTLRNVAVNDPFAQGGPSQVMRFHVTHSAADDSRVPSELSPADEAPERLDERDAVRTRRFEFRSSGGMWTINGQRFDPNNVLADPRLGDTEIWEFSGTQGHPVHVHLVHFRVLSRQGNRGPDAADAGWKDTVWLGRDARVLARFGPYRGRYVMHCHNLEHEDMMMMGNFDVI